MDPVVGGAIGSAWSRSPAMVGALVAYDRARREHHYLWAAPSLDSWQAGCTRWQGELVILADLGSELLARARSRRAGPGRSLLLPQARSPRRRCRWCITPCRAALTRSAKLPRRSPDTTRGPGPRARRCRSCRCLCLPRRRSRAPEGFIGLSARVWPLVSSLVWFVTKAGLGATPLAPAWTGITVPLAVLAIEGVKVAGFRRFPAHRWIGALAVAALQFRGATSGEARRGIHRARDRQPESDHAHAQTGARFGISRTIRHLGPCRAS